MFAKVDQMNEFHNKDLGRFNLQGLLMLMKLKMRVKMVVFTGPFSPSSSVFSADEGFGGHNVSSQCPSMFRVLLIDLLLLLYSC